MRQRYYTVYLLLILIPASLRAESSTLLHGIKIMDAKMAAPVISAIFSGTHQREIIAIDRHGREHVRVIDADAENTAITLLRMGAAIIWDSGFASPDDISVMFAVEADARAKRRGIWQNMRVMDANNDFIVYNQIAIVQGVVYEATRRNGNIYINFGEDWREDFTLFIPKDRARNIADSWLAELAGKTVRMRGMVYSYYGPMIDVLTTEMMEIIE